jgi:hypothetical protein
MPKFYEYIQNNSGGHFNVDDARGIGEYVIVEAHDLPHANLRAEQIGLYFDGVDAGIDCDCCGDRWYQPWADRGTDEPTVYGDPVRKVKKSSLRHQAFVHYLDGHVERVALAA